MFKWLLRKKMLKALDKYYKPLVSLYPCRDLDKDYTCGITIIDFCRELKIISKREHGRLLKAFKQADEKRQTLKKYEEYGREVWGYRKRVEHNEI